MAKDRAFTVHGPEKELRERGMQRKVEGVLRKALDLKGADKENEVESVRSGGDLCAAGR